MQELLTQHLVDPHTVAELVALTGKGETTIRKHIKTLVDAGEVVKEDGKYRLITRADLAASVADDEAPATEKPAKVKSGKPATRSSFPKTEKAKAEDDAACKFFLDSPDAEYTVEDLAAHVAQVVGYDINGTHKALLKWRLIHIDRDVIEHGEKRNTYRLSARLRQSAK